MKQCLRVLEQIQPATQAQWRAACRASCIVQKESRLPEDVDAAIRQCIRSGHAYCRPDQDAENPDTKWQLSGPLGVLLTRLRRQTDAEAEEETAKGRGLPDGCPRDIEGCGPLHRIASDEGDSYVCCGLRYSVDKPDPYRFCFKTAETDTMYDHDALDMLDTIEVMTRALSTVQRLRDGME